MAWPSRQHKTPGMPLDRLLDTGIAIADALGAAHERGIVHRDLTPRNVMVTKDGRVKVLDFGLARLRDADSPSADQHGPVTTTTPLTGAHQIVGTPAYMSPEQVEGKAIDQRSDLFSLGTMLYEMASGERPFKGDSAISILSSIVRDAPRPLTEVVPVQPRGLWRIVRRALAKDVEARYQSAKDLRNDLRELKHDIESGELGSATLPAVVARTRLPVVALLVAGIAGLIAGWLLLGRGWREAPVAAEVPRQVIRFQITNPDASDAEARDRTPERGDYPRRLTDCLRDAERRFVGPGRAPVPAVARRGHAAGVRAGPRVHARFLA